MTPRQRRRPVHIGQLERCGEILKLVTAYGQAMDLDMIQADYEDPGQIEMNYHSPGVRPPTGW